MACQVQVAEAGGWAPDPLPDHSGWTGCPGAVLPPTIPRALEDRPAVTAVTCSRHPCPCKCGWPWLPGTTTACGDRGLCLGDMQHVWWAPCRQICHGVQSLVGEVEDRCQARSHCWGRGQWPQHRGLARELVSLLGTWTGQLPLGHTPQNLELEPFAGLEQWPAFSTPSWRGLS